MSASKNKPWKKFIRRDKLQGGGRGKKGKPFFRGEAAYVKRLRRLEVVVLHLTAHLELSDILLASMLDDMLVMKDVVEPKPGSGDPDTRDAFSIPHSGPADGQVEGDIAAVIRAREEFERESQT